MAENKKNQGMTEEDIAEMRAEMSRGQFTHDFKKAVEHGGKTYAALHFDFDALTGRDCRLIERELAAQGIHVFSRELSPDYQVLFAVRACQENIGEDFFDVIPARDFNAIMKRVQSFLLRAE